MAKELETAGADNTGDWCLVSEFADVFVRNAVLPGNSFYVTHQVAQVPHKLSSCGPRFCTTEDDRKDEDSTR